jgi:hypothetical protein
MDGWSDIVDGEVSFSEKVTRAWRSLLGDSSSDSEETSKSEPEPEPDDTEWWYGDAPALKWPRPEPLRMAPMQAADAAPTIEVKIYHNGIVKAAEVVAVYAEFALRDAWGDRYHIDVSVHEEPVTQIKDSDAFFAWVDEQPDAAKDANILIASSGGWRLVGGGNAGVAQRGRKIAKLYGETLFVDGSTAGHGEVSTALHELLHCLGFDHREGGRIGSAVTPMGHYGNNGSTWSFRLHPDVRGMEPDVQ